jgi:hypothetical protein
MSNERTCVRCDVEKRPKDYLGDNDVCKDCAMTRLTVQAIKDYQVCSLFYSYRYEDKEYEPLNNRVLMADRFHETLTRVVAFFFYKKQSGVTPSYNAIINRWERLWFPKDMDAYDVAVEQHTVSHGNLTQYSTQAAKGLLKLYEDFEDKSIQPILIDEDYSVPIRSDIILDGTLDLVYRIDGEYHVIKWVTTQKRPTMPSLVMEFAGTRAAYDHRKPAGQKVNYAIYDLGSDNPGRVDYDMTDVPAGMIEYWAEQAKLGEFVPRRGYTAYCKGCPFDIPCKGFSFVGLT